MVEMTTVNFMRPDLLWRFPKGPPSLDPLKDHEDYCRGMRVEGVPVSALVVMGEKVPNRGVHLQLAANRQFFSQGKLKPGVAVAGEFDLRHDDCVWIRRKTSLRLNTTLLFMANQLYGSAANGLAHIQKIARDCCYEQLYTWLDIVDALKDGPLLSSQLNVPLPPNTSVAVVVRDTIERAYCEANGMGAEHTQRVGTGRYQREGPVPREEVEPLAFTGENVSLFVNQSGEMDGRLLRPIGSYRGGILFSHLKKPALLEDILEECLVSGSKEDANLVERYLDKRFPTWRLPPAPIGAAEDDAWVVLNVPENATFEEAQLSYRRLMKIFHQDKGLVEHRYFAQKLNEAMQFFKRNNR